MMECFNGHENLLYTMQEPSCLTTIVLVSIWFSMVLTQTITQVFKGFLDIL